MVVHAKIRTLSLDLPSEGTIDAREGNCRCYERTIETKDLNQNRSVTDLRIRALPMSTNWSHIKINHLRINVTLFIAVVI
jgi:hypothetical protein